MILTLDALGLGLRTIRLQHQMTLKQLSSISELSVSFLSDIENDRSVPSLRTLQILATCYGKSFQLMIGGNQTCVFDDLDGLGGHPAHDGLAYDPEVG